VGDGKKEGRRRRHKPKIAIQCRAEGASRGKGWWARASGSRPAVRGSTITSLTGQGHWPSPQGYSLSGISVVIGCDGRQPARQGYQGESASHTRWGLRVCGS
jgi:hypothetical protein